MNHLNRLHRDHDSACTGYGLHDRVICTHPTGNEMYMRIDNVWNLGMPTKQQMLQVARTRQGTTGKWIIDRIEPWNNGQSFDVYFTRTQNSRAGFAKIT
jgi:hypothetical protein